MNSERFYISNHKAVEDTVLQISDWLYLFAAMKFDLIDFPWVSLKGCVVLPFKKKC